MTAQRLDKDGSGYFLYHSIGQYPGKAEDIAAAMAEFAGVWGAPDDGQWGAILGRRGEFIEHWRRLIGAPEGTVTTSENVTAALYALIGALPGKHLKGRKLLVAGDCFPSLHFLLTALAPRFGFSLETVPLRQGASYVEDEDVIAQWDETVGLALLTWVSSTSSHRADIAALTAHGRKMGSLVGVDITQAAGLLPFSVNEPAVDFTISTSLKWMCGTPGAGMLHVASDLIAACEHEFRGWFSQENPFSWDLDKFHYASDIRRFDNGTPSVVSALASLPAMRWHAAQDQQALLAHNRALSDAIFAGIEGLPFSLVSPRDDNARGGSVMIRLEDSQTAEGLLSTLRDRGIYADRRDALLRFSPGPVTTMDGVAVLVDAMRTHLS
jgi:kynureninase